MRLAAADLHANDRAHCRVRAVTRSTGERDRQRHVAGLLSRTPRPPPELRHCRPMSSMPSASSAAISFISESTLPRIDAVACLHALDGRQRQPGRFGKSPLVDAEKRAGRSDLTGCEPGETVGNGFIDLNHQIHLEAARPIIFDVHRKMPQRRSPPSFPTLPIETVRGRPTTDNPDNRAAALVRWGRGVSEALAGLPRHVQGPINAEVNDLVSA